MLVVWIIHSLFIMNFLRLRQTLKDAFAFSSDDHIKFQQLLIAAELPLLKLGIGYSANFPSFA